MTPGPHGPVPTRIAPAGGDGRGVCWAAVGGTAAAVAAAGTQATINIGIANYSWFKPRKLTTNAWGDAAGATDDLTRFTRVISVTANGRNIIGNAAGISGASIAAGSENSLRFGGSVSPIAQGQTIVVVVQNDHATLAADINIDIEGEALQ